MAKVYHDLVVNVETGAYTVKPVLDIHQGDSNTHVLLIKLRDSKNNFVSISETSKANIKFFYDDTLIMSSAVEVVNAYRGVLQYLIGPALVKNSGRYTVYLDISQCECDCVCGPTVSFTMTVSKCHDQGFNDSEIEVTITKEQLNEIMAHLANAEIHLDEMDRDFLDTFVPLKDDLEKLVESLTPDKVLKTAFTTVDFRDQMTVLTRENVVEGKIVRVNYPDYDGDHSTVNEDWYNPKYYACHLLGDEETIEWVLMDFTGGVEKRVSQLEGKFVVLKEEVDNEVVHTTDEDERVLSVDGTEIKSTLTIDTYRDQADDTVYISLKGIDGEEISRIDASQFVKDGMIDDVSYDSTTHMLIIVFNTDAGKESVTIDLSELFEINVITEGGNFNDLADGYYLVACEGGNFLQIDLDPSIYGEAALVRIRYGFLSKVTTSGATPWIYYVVTGSLEIYTASTSTRSLIGVRTLRGRSTNGSTYSLESDAVAGVIGLRGSEPVAVGSGSKAMGKSSTAVGPQSDASGHSSVAVGKDATATYDYGIALGWQATAGGTYGSAPNSIAIGKTARTSADSAIQIGSGQNNSQGTLQIFDKQLLDANGKVPNARLTLDSTISDQATNGDVPSSLAVYNFVSNAFNQGLDPAYEPTEPESVATKEYVDEQIALWSSIGGNA